MIIWLLMYAVLFLACFGCVFYLSRKLRKHQLLWRHSRRKPTLLSYAIVLIPLAVLWVWLGFINMIIILLHLTLFWMLSELLQKAVERKKPLRHNYAGVLALLLTAAYLCTAGVMAFHVRQVDYTITTEKEVGSLRVALIADSHMGTTFGGTGFAKQLQKIEAQNPDVLVIAGDYVDEDTTRKEMEDACRALGQMHTTYGIYYVLGNHDWGNYTNSREFSGEDLVAALEENGVTVLRDEAAVIDGRFTILGREDASEELYSGKARENMETLMEKAEDGTYTIVLDHQPRDYAAQAAAGADLVLSGHTHGGQFFPMAQLMDGLHVGGNDLVYGHKQVDNTDFIVTSGISDWALIFRTGYGSEFVIVNILEKR